MKRRPWRFKGLPFYKHPFVRRLRFAAPIFVGSLVIIFTLPTDVPEKYKLVFFIICSMICFAILRISVHEASEWYEANKAERARNEALFLQQQIDDHAPPKS